MSGTSADDIFLGLNGNDTLSGGEGQDTYRFGYGMGKQQSAANEPMPLAA